MEGTAMAAIDPLTAGAVVLATAATDAVYVMFTSAVVARKRVPAATWSSVWYLLSSYAVISYTENWIYVVFAANLIDLLPRELLCWYSRRHAGIAEEAVQAGRHHDPKQKRFLIGI